MKGKVFECRTCGEKFGENPSLWALFDHWKIHHPDASSGTYQARFEQHSKQLKFSFQRVIKKNIESESAAVETISKSRDSARRRVARVINCKTSSKLSDFTSNSNTSRQIYYDSETTSNRPDFNSEIEPSPLLQCRQCGLKLSSFAAVRNHYESHKLEEPQIQTASNTISETMGHAVPTTSEHVITRNPETLENNPVLSNQTSQVETSDSATIELSHMNALQQLTSCPNTRCEAKASNLLKTAIVIQSLSQDMEYLDTPQQEGNANELDRTFTERCTSCPNTRREASNLKTAVVGNADEVYRTFTGQCTSCPNTKWEASNLKTAVVIQSLSQDMEQLDTPPQVGNTDELDRTFTERCGLTKENPVSQPDKRVHTSEPETQNCALQKHTAPEKTQTTQMEKPNVVKVSYHNKGHPAPNPLSYTEEEMLAAKRVSSAILESGLSNNAESDNLKNEGINFAEESHSTENSENTTARPTTSSPRNQSRDRVLSRNAVATLLAFGLSSAADSYDSAKKNVNVLPIVSPKGAENEQSLELLVDALSEMIAASESAKGGENGTETQPNEEEMRIVTLASSATGSAEVHAKRRVDVAVDAETWRNGQEKIGIVGLASLVAGSAEAHAKPRVDVAVDAETRRNGQEKIGIVGLASLVAGSAEAHAKPRVDVAVDAETRRNGQEKIGIVGLVSLGAGSAEAHAKQRVDVAVDAETTDTAPESIMRTLSTNLRPDLRTTNPKQNKNFCKNGKKVKENQQPYNKPQGKGKRNGPKKTKIRFNQSSSLVDSDTERTRMVLNKTKPSSNRLNTGKTAKKTPQKSAWDGLFWNSTKDGTCAAQRLPDLRILESIFDDSVSTDSSFEDVNF